MRHESYSITYGTGETSMHTCRLSIVSTREVGAECSEKQLLHVTALSLSTIYVKARTLTLNRLPQRVSTPT